MIDEKEWLTTHEVCERLVAAGLPIAPRALRGWREKGWGKLTWRQHGRNWRISAYSVNEFIRKESSDA